MLMIMLAIFDVHNKPMIDGCGCMAWQASCTERRARLAAGTLLREFFSEHTKRVIF